MIQSTQRVKPLAKRSHWWLLVAVLAVVSVAVPWLQPGPYILYAIDILIFALFATSLNLLVGQTGMVSFGHAAYFAIGAYVAGLLVVRAGWDMPWAFVAAPPAAAFAAFLIGLFCVRLTHAYFIMLTLAFAELIHSVVWKWRDMTGGDDGLLGVRTPPPFDTSLGYYYLTLVVVAVCLVLLFFISRSPFGRTCRAIKDNPRRVEFMGINVAKHKLLAFVTAGFFAGVAGDLFVFFNRGAFQAIADWLTSAQGLTMVILGGPSYFAGPLVGAIVYTLLSSIVPKYTEYWLLVLGIILGAVVLLMPNGIVGFLAERRDRRDNHG
ncbi:MAG: branched-chain amino acid ABC transporter permease [Dehalococcoidia bacterium]|nr:branched-chain amino acid ABC transporter permease [Dehalococcoidia bacterium]